MIRQNDVLRVRVLVVSRRLRVPCCYTVMCETQFLIHFFQIILLWPTELSIRTKRICKWYKKIKRHNKSESEVIFNNFSLFKKQNQNENINSIWIGDIPDSIWCFRVQTLIKLHFVVGVHEFKIGRYGPNNNWQKEEEKSKRENGALFTWLPLSPR